MLTRTDHRIDFSKFNISFEENKTALNQPTGNFFYDPWKIKPEFKDTVWATILDSLPGPIGEARVIKMAPGTTYMAHADIDDRYHLSLQGENSYLLDLTDNVMYPLKQDHYWYDMDAGRIHVACNFGSIDRYQLVVRKLLLSSNEKDLVTVTILPHEEKYDYRYQFDNIVSPWLNRVNKKLSMKDFSFKENTVSFKVLESELESLKLTNDFKMLVSYS